MARGPGSHWVGAGLAALRRWRRRLAGDSMAIDLSPMVERPADLVDDQSRRGPGWPPGVQEEDDLHWKLDPGPTAPGASAPATPGAGEPRSKS
jgi:hypothetical protein